MIPGIETGTRIGTLRIRAPGSARDSVTTACPAVMRALDLEPPAMASQEILCVRALGDPLPGGIDVRSRQAQMRPLAWESAMRASLGESRRRAVRPIHGPVPATADSVLFADAAELLACAARDACRGSLSWFWWWRHLVPEASFEQVVHIWRRAPEYAPAAFELLASTGAAMEFTRRLTAVQAATLLDIVLRTYALPSLADAVASVWRDSTSVHTDRADRGRPTSADDRARPASVGAPAPPWRGVVDSEWEHAGLGAEARTWAAMVLVLRRSPWLARRAAFAPAVVTYLRSQAQPHAHTGTSGPAPESAAGRDTAPLSLPRIEATTEADRRTLDATGLAEPEAGSRAAPRATGPDVVAHSTASRARSRDEVATERPSPTTLVAPSAQAGNSLPPRAIANPSAIDGPDVPRPTRDVEGGPPLLDLDVRVDSSCAGAFFLLNLALDLGLYSHGLVVCEEVELGVWDFVELVALDILGAEESVDPLWPLLHDLADPARVDAADRRAESGDARCSRKRVEDLSHAERDELVVRVRDYLRLAMKVEDPGSFLIRRRGSIGRSPGHLDVHFSLERHPIEIRLARLDRNPGWIPAAGVQVAFHFD